MSATIEASKKKINPMSNEELYTWSNKVNWSVYYFMENSFFETDSLSYSKLTWNTMFMHGAGTRIDFPISKKYRMELEVEGARNVMGYSVDDDLRNHLVTVSYGGILNEYAQASIRAGTTTYLGKIKNSWLAGFTLTNHDLRMLGHMSMNASGHYADRYSPTTVTQDYNLFLLGLGVKTDFSYQHKATLFSLLLDFRLPWYLVIAHWPFRSDWQHPISFVNNGLSVFFEFRLRSQTFFSKKFSMHLDFKLSMLYLPWVTRITYLTNPNRAVFHFSSIHYAFGWRTGLEIGFDFHF